MKTFLPILIILTLFTGFVNAQIPNSGMENWDQFTFYEDPADWTTFNQFSLLAGAPFTVTKTTDAHSGTYAASLESILVVDSSGTTELPGILLSLDANGNGFPVNQRYTNFSFWYKYSNAGGDTAMVAAALTKWNAATQTADSVGFAVAIITGSVNTYTQINVPIQYYNSQTPDTAVIGAFSSVRENFVDGSVLKIDDFAFSGIASIVELSSAYINIYPNPAAYEIFVDLETPLKGKIEIFDLSGRLILSELLTEMKNMISVATLPKNAYLYSISETTGKTIKSGRMQLGQ